MVVVLDEKEWAYLAGLVDGEGALDLGIHLRTSKYKGRIYRALGCSPNLVIILKSHPINRAVMEWISRTFKTPVQDYRGRFRVQFTGKVLETVLQKIQPYLKIKSEEAKILLEALRLNKEKKSYWTPAIARKFAELQDNLLANRLRNRGRVRKWTGERIVATFHKIIEERKKAGIRTGVLIPRKCRNCGRELSKQQVWCRQIFCTVKCYQAYRFKKNPGVPLVAHEYVVVVGKKAEGGGL
jgi:hypothetical protein